MFDGDLGGDTGEINRETGDLLYNRRFVTRWSQHLSRDISTRLDVP